MTERCILCKEYLWEWKGHHTCKPSFYVWIKEYGETFSDAYDGGQRIFADDAEAAAIADFSGDYERTEIQVHVLADAKADTVIDELAECDQSEAEIKRLNDVADTLAEVFDLTAEVVRQVSARPVIRKEQP